MEISESKGQLGELLKIDELQEEVKEIEGQMADPDFWSDKEKSTHLSQRLSDIKNLLDRFEKAQTDKDLEELEKEALFAEKYDQRPAILSIHAGAGGTEAQDWASMLFRMYERFGERKNFQVKELEKSPGEEAGIKSATLRISGLNAFGNLKSEAGVHRLVRISPFDADKARHTSFVLVEVIPELEEVEETPIGEKDLRIDVYRSSGHGGQSVNTTDSAVRITHLSTGIVVAVQNERSQLQNKQTALKILQAKLHQLKLREKQEEVQKLKGDYLKAEWGSQIRSYVLMPYQLVKDHRTGYEETNPDKVLGGEIDGFVDAYLKQLSLH